MAEAGALTESYRGLVPAWECDVMEHLTLAFYFDHFADAALTLIEGLAPGLLPGAAWRSSRLLVRYQKELRAGDGIATRSGLIAAKTDAIVIGHQLLATGEGDVATLAEHHLAPRELPCGGRSEMRQMLAASVVPWISLGFDLIAVPARPEGMIASGSDRVKAWEADESGELSLSGYVHRFARACSHVCSACGMTPAYMRLHRRGFATFETRLHLLAPPPGAGEGLVVRSGLVAAGNSSLHMMHEMRRGDGGELLARFHQAGVHFDMEARRSEPLPPALHEMAHALVMR